MQPTRREEGDNVLFDLTLDDRVLLDSIEITEYSEIDEQVEHQMCIMQVVRMLELGKTPEDLREEQAKFDRSGDADSMDPPEGFDDDPICVSEQIVRAMIAVNDSCMDEERSSLKELIPEIMNTCPVRKSKYFDMRDRTEKYMRLEDRRADVIGRHYEFKLLPFERQVELIREAAAVR